MTAIRILIAAGILTAARVYMIADRMMLLTSGRSITLQVVPVDPTEMFRGDYVILSYKISRLDLAVLHGPDAFIVQRPVFVVLKNDGQAWVPITVSDKLIAAGPDQVVIRGTVTSYQPNADDKAPPVLSVEYGIESFFVPQGEGKDIESARNADKVTAEVAVANDGRVALKAVLVDGKSVFSETLF